MPRFSHPAIPIVLAAVLIDTIGFGIVMPVLPKLITVLGHVDLEQATRVGGYMLVVFSIAQFFAGPVLGNLSDRFGRRPVLLVSFPATMPILKHGLLPGNRSYGVLRFVLVVPSLLTIGLLTIGIAGAAYGQTSQSNSSPAKIEVPKVEREGVWQPTPGGTQVPLWPANVSLTKPDTGDHPEATGNGSPLVGGRMWYWASYITRPTMTIYKPRGRNTGATMMVLPGGGFYAVATDLEGTEICDWVVRQGMTCVMVKYRTPQVWEKETGKQQRPKVLLGLEDAQRAMGLLRQRASTYGIDPHKIGVIGFSAGAYLVANMSNMEERTYALTDAADRQSPRPDFAIVAYTARMLDNSKGKNNLELQPWVKISPNAPPTLIIHAMNDPTDDVRQGIAYALALNDAGVPVDMRLYAKGGHAFGMRPTADPITKEWPGQVKQWLQNLGVL
jgi:acetyl esterase/lipase